jgi:hypothetical protein
VLAEKLFWIFAAIARSHLAQPGLRPPEASCSLDRQPTAHRHGARRRRVDPNCAAVISRASPDELSCRSYCATKTHAGRLGPFILVAAELQAKNPVVGFFRRLQAAGHNRFGASSRILRWRLPNPASQIGISNTRTCTARAPDFPHNLSILFQPGKIWQSALIANICPCTAYAADFPRS